MGRLPLRKRRGRKRVKVESQDQETEESLAAQADHEQVEKISACLRRLQLEPEMPLESQLPNVLAEGVAALGVAKWLSVRQGGGKLAARKALVSGESTHELTYSSSSQSTSTNLTGKRSRIRTRSLLRWKTLRTSTTTTISVHLLHPITPFLVHRTRVIVSCKTQTTIPTTSTLKSVTKTSTRASTPPMIRWYTCLGAATLRKPINH